MRKTDRKTLLFVFLLGVVAIILMVLLINQSPSGAQADVPRVTVAETKRAMDAGTALIIDVRSRASFQQSHISGAVSAPLTSEETYLVDAPRDALLYLYCT